MKLTSLLNEKHFFIIILLLSVTISVVLGIKTTHINYWPTDSYQPYIPAATRLFDQPYISDIHQVVGFKLIMRGKETLLLGIALMQRLLGDFRSLYPNVLLLIIAVNISSILMYQIFKKLFDPLTGFLAFLLFAFSYGPYLYILQGAHPPLVIMNFLIAIALLQQARGRKFFTLLSGLFLGLMLFSSPTATLYLPYYFVFFLYNQKQEYEETPLRDRFITLICILLGVFVILLYFTAPHPVMYIKSFIQFLAYSQVGNDFIIWRDQLSQYFTIPDHMRGGGWPWIFKYHFFSMPILFSVYVISLLVLLKQSLKKRAWLIIVGLSFTTPIAVEIIQVAQLGRNYFSWMIGIIGVVCTTFYLVKEQAKERKPIVNNILMGGLLLILVAHGGFNGSVFVKDIFPSRMANTTMYQWLIDHQAPYVFTYREHPRNKNITQFLKNPKIKEDIRLVGIKSIAQVPTGYILIPPLTGKTIWNSCKDDDFEGDPLLTLLFESGELDQYVVASSKTLASSRFWLQEQEVCTYRDLMLRQISKEDLRKGYIWILDARKLHTTWLPKMLSQTSI